MSYYENLAAEIAEKVDALEAERKPLNASWITHAVCNDHVAGLAENEHADFWRHGGYHTVRKETARYISKRHGDDAERLAQRRQPAFPGFPLVQSHYLVDRDGEQIGVPSNDMTDEEIDAKADLYDVMGATCRDHADQLRRFKIWRPALRRSVAAE